MNIERLNLIEEIYHAALEIPVERRREFFKMNCGADEDLRREVESLLPFENTFADLLDAPLDAFAAEMFREDG